MKQEKLLAILSQGASTWNAWRQENPNITLDFRGVNLEYKDLTGADLHGADFSAAAFYRTILVGANLSGARFNNADLGSTNMSGANLSGATLMWANLTEATLIGADLSEAHLEGSNLTESHFEDANLSGCHIYGISAWNLHLNANTRQSNLVITKDGEIPVRVDNLEVAHFLYLLLNREKIRNALNTITSKCVLILGRFTKQRKAILDALADQVRLQGLVPIIFDFERSENRDFTETIKILAGISLFVIVDLTKPRSAPHEITAVIPDYQIPFVPILKENEEPYAMFDDFKKFNWLLKPIRKYHTKKDLVDNFKQVILDPAWKKHLEIIRSKNTQVESMTIKEMVAQGMNSPANTIIGS